MTIECLYKYGRIGDHSEALFSTARLWFSDPAGLNDPFECQPWFTFDGTQAEVVEWLVKFIRQRDPYITPDAAMAEAVGIYLQGRHRDPKIWTHLRKSVLRMLGSEIGICSLSRVPDSILMWSHYAEEHRGFCLEFEATDETYMFGEAQPVHYSEEFPDVDFFNTPKEKQVDMIFLTKHLSWAYEHELRIVDHINGPGLREYPKELLRSVIFGLRMSDSDKAKVRAWLSQRGHPVRLLQAVQHDRKFSIELHETA